MNLRTPSWKVILSGVALVLLVCALWMIWNYVYSFQTVTFRYDRSLGYLQLSGNNQPNFYPAAGQPVKLKKGEYRITHVGTRIAPDTYTQTIDASTTTVIATFNYTRQYLATVYSAQQPAIEQALMQAYPAIATDYTIAHAKLYHRGELYGAILVPRDQSGDNADTLRVLMRQRDTAWVVLSRPPAPVLSAPLYPDIDRAILVDINRAK